ncbi:MAG: type I methionyl aminopeptidase [Pseudomonadales bacterium]|nr:type I methionyl aminopeptidase [Candidatus Woesebacteria bacterium]MCB9801726.1 type I methionyl aminopeptidase [Pseudomonadales bacterium]
MSDRVKAKVVAMRRGGRALAQVRDTLQHTTELGNTFAQIEERAQVLIKQAGFTPSFSTVPGYRWATCIMKNHELCHGIPSSEKRVESGDIITIDIGLVSDGYHLDTTVSFGVGEMKSEHEQFLLVGRQAVDAAIGVVKDGASVYHISRAMEKRLKKHNYGAVYQLTGHGVGKKLHMEPAIPVYAQKSDKRVRVSSGDTLAIEVMYAAGDPELVLSDDGWTYQTKDGSYTAMFEETVLVTDRGYQVLTK